MMMTIVPLPHSRSHERQWGGEAPGSCKSSEGRWVLTHGLWGIWEMDLKMVTNLIILWKWIVEEEKEKP